MKEKGLIRWSKGNWKVGKNWDLKQDDPVTLRLKEYGRLRGAVMLMALNVRLPNMAEHYEERLGGYRRYDDIPPGSKIAKRWSEFHGWDQDTFCYVG